jgi:cyclophilin family peptidyl-prolyl cis-trans isomerase
MKRQNYQHAVLFALILLSSCAKPIANFMVKEPQRVAPATIIFQNNSKQADRYEWDFGDGAKSKDSIGIHEYKRSGNYTVILKAYKGNKMSQTTQKVHIDAPLKCLVEIETDFGTMLVELSNSTPLHRDNFIKLAEQGFYDGTLFHRVISGFMIQGGDPNSKEAPIDRQLGAGDPGYTIPAEIKDTLVHIKGALAAARTQNPEKRSSGSQFYIVHGRKSSANDISYYESQKGIHYTPEQKRILMDEGGVPFLDKDYTIFGQVIKGFDVIDKIANVEKNSADRPMKNVSMKVRVIK